MMQWQRIWLMILAVVVSSGLIANTSLAATEDEYYELMKVFVDTFEQIDRNYVTQVDRRELMEAAMRGMIMKLDPYSSYIDNKELRDFNEHVEREFGAAMHATDAAGRKDADAGAGGCNHRRGDGGRAGAAFGDREGEVGARDLHRPLRLRQFF